MSESPANQLATALRTAGYSLTKPRKIVFQLLQQPEPQSIAALIARAEGSIDRVSVYRTVQLFEALNIVRRIYGGWKYKLELTDQYMQHHHHLTCLGCGRIIDIKDEEPVERFIQQMAHRYGFVPRSHQFEVDGYCQACAQSKPVIAATV